MKRIFVLLFSGLLFWGCVSEKKETNNTSKTKLNVIYVTGISDKEAIFEAKEIFSEKFDLNIVTFAECYDAFESLKDSAFTPDIFMGLDNTFYSKAINDSLFLQHIPNNVRLSANEPEVYKDTLIPYAYSWLAFNYDEMVIDEVPDTFGKMQDGIRKDSFIILNPETTSLGRAMLISSVRSFGINGYGHFWKSIKSNVFTVCNTTEEAINMFLAMEAPIVLGLSTADFLGGSRKAFIPKEGGVRFVKSMAIFNQSMNIDGAKDFMEIVLAERYQTEIMKNEMLFPMNKNVDLTSGFITSPVPIKELNSKYSETEFAKRLRRWKQIIN